MDAIKRKVDNYSNSKLTNRTDAVERTARRYATPQQIYNYSSKALGTASAFYLGSKAIDNQIQ